MLAVCLIIDSMIGDYTEALWNSGIRWDTTSTTLSDSSDLTAVCIVTMDSSSRSLSQLHREKANHSAVSNSVD